MGEQLTIEQIRERYDGDWVALDEVEVNENDEVVAGRVFAHNLERDAFDDEVGRIAPRSFAVECFKSLPAGWGFAFCPSIFDRASRS